MSAQEVEPDWMAEAALYCQPHGEKHDALACLRQLAEAAANGGRWSADIDSCDCGDGYGCSHGSWVHAVHVEKTHSANARTDKCDPEGGLDAYLHDRSELSDFSWDEAHYIVAAQPSVVLDLLDRLAAVEALADEFQTFTGQARAAVQGKRPSDKMAGREAIVWFDAERRLRRALEVATPPTQSSDGAA